MKYMCAEVGANKEKKSIIKGQHNYETLLKILDKYHISFNSILDLLRSMFCVRDATTLNAKCLLTLRKSLFNQSAMHVETSITLTVLTKQVHIL